MKNESTSMNFIDQISDEHFNALYEITKMLNAADLEEELFTKALDWIIQSVSAERGLFVKYNSGKNNFSIIVARNIEKESIYNLSEFSSGVLRQVVDQKKSIIYHDVQSDPTLSQFESVRIKKIKSVIGVPIFNGQKIYGVILADSTKNRKDFNERSLRFINFFSNLVSLALEKIENFRHLKEENKNLIERLSGTALIPGMLGNSPAVQKLAKLINRVAMTDATVLIYGESGSGKELAAEAIHKLSKRNKGPFLAQFCGSIPDSLLESELFGHKKGTFTGAVSDKIGLLEAADGGTFFLDEIADISEALQTKLLRVLDKKEIIRLGETNIRKIDVRIIAATNKNLSDLVKEGKFREDLLYRLNVFPVNVPSLRERKEDIPLLTDNIIKSSAKPSLRLNEKALNKIIKYSWPGNVRQLINVLHRAVILSDGKTITEDEIIIEDDDSVLGFEGTLKEFEQKLLLERLKQFDGNRTRTAESLGVSVRWVQLKLKEMKEHKT